MASRFVSGDEYRERVGQTLRRIRPDSNRTGWYAWIADELENSDTAVREWTYGNKGPDGPNFLGLCYLLPDFKHEFFGQPEANGDSEFAAEIKAVVEKHQNGA